MASKSPSLQSRAKRYGTIAAASMAGFVVLNTAANRGWPVIGPIAQRVRQFVNQGV